MRLRALVLSVLVLLVLAMSTGAPACDLFCSFVQTHFFGHERCLAHGAKSSAVSTTKTEAADGTMDDMAMDHMAMPGVTQQMALPGDSPIATATTMAACVREPCSQAAISVSSKFTVDRFPRTIACTLASSATAFAPRLSPSCTKQFDATPPKLGPLDPPGMTLRV